MSRMTRKERLMAVFRGEPVDRAPVKLWNLTPGQELLHPAFQPVYELGLARTDLVIGAGSPFDLFCGTRRDSVVKSEERPTDSPDWVNVVTTLHTPQGDLRSVSRRSTRKKPGYEMEHFVKEPADIRRLLSVPYEPFPFSADPYRERVQKIGDAGIVMFGLDHATYGLERVMGSENFALWSLEYRDLFSEAIAVLAQRLYAHVEAALASGLRPIFAWVGPELCIPPLMSLADFDELLFPYDKRLCDLIHEGGGFVWVHCHGKMRALLERFIAMGVDMLNPIEPPPMGDVAIEEAFGLVQNRMALEGNLEAHDMLMATKDELAAKIEDAVRAGSRDGRRHILCSSSGYMETPEPTDRLIENTLFYVEEGIRLAEEYGRRQDVGNIGT